MGETNWKQLKGWVTLPRALKDRSKGTSLSQQFTGNITEVLLGELLVLIIAMTVG